MADRKRTSPFDWEDVRYFLALSRLGNLSATARQLRVSHVTIARRISSLEKSLGCVVFDRRPDGYSLTAQGETMMKLALTMEHSAVAIEESMANVEAHGTVRISMVRSLANQFLVERLRKFRKENPGIILDVLAENRVVSLARREADIALRLGRPKDSSLVGRKIAQLRYAFYASTDYEDVQIERELPQIITYDEDSVDLPEANYVAQKLGKYPVSFRSNSNEAQAAAARAGFGVVMLPRYLGDIDGGLREVDLVDPHPPRDLWILSPKELSRVPRLRAVISAITEAIQTHKDRL